MSVTLLTSQEERLKLKWVRPSNIFCGARQGRTVEREPTRQPPSPTPRGAGGKRTAMLVAALTSHALMSS